MLYLKQKNIKKQLTVFSFYLILILLTGCVKQKQVVIDNQKSEIINKNEDKKTEINATENKDETDNVETNTEKNNEKESKIIWKKYTNPLYGFSFEYPDHLKITRDKKNDCVFEIKDDPDEIKDCWPIKMESADYKMQMAEFPYPHTDLISGFCLSVHANPSTSNITFEELMEYKQLGYGGSPIIKQETRESNSRKFFIQTTQETFNDLNWSVSALYNPNLIIGIGISGTKENKEEMETILNHFIETFK